MNFNQIKIYTMLVIRLPLVLPSSAFIKYFFFARKKSQRVNGRNRPKFSTVHAFQDRNATYHSVPQT